MPEMNSEAAFQRAETWRAACKSKIISSAREEIIVTIFIGMAVFPRNGKTVGALLGEADRALYSAKLSGRDCTCIADPQNIL